jgi:hypothetical protein
MAVDFALLARRGLEHLFERRAAAVFYHAEMLQ